MPRARHRAARHTGRWRPPAGARTRARRRRPGRAAPCSSMPSVRTSVTSGSPLVSVPVLSMTTVSMRADASRAAAFLTSTPRLAPRPVPTMIAVGVARPSASGQVITTTVMAKSSAVSTPAPDQSQTRKVPTPPTRATSTSQKAARSASRCPGALEFCASWTRATIWASAVSEPTLVARTRSVPVVLMEAPMTSEPGVLATGRLSPVTIDSSTSEMPSATTPSTGTFPPGRMRSRSPTWTSPVGTSTGSPSRRTVAIGGARSIRARMASLAPPRARISNQWPRSTKVVSMAAAS